ncbi:MULTISPECIES: sporulation protein YjcZ [Thermoactinomyces]|uniref:Sporulation protein YjcZ n=1 Tax=Thermoactinomyces daqus TaxID=1329516 RepID=A0A7W1XB40_9BACL|nr:MULTISPECIES: sporulation protein YjcZ [Thermoactinomyces]MBA4543293.1 sporulation protein YjcZ [Thermoactinomyces daqus]MBH8598433.1 sporulation protein YjcZ [Thermoactinomyces sp. CICC 10523]MBH8604722.1 sporulation protein YjcZ [Thermoactinomyces sp. CICC 10522]MBH8606817.1 sporulation protein YjcZ [Thermoactinomyces sp. CICC 10521]
MGASCGSCYSSCYGSCYGYGFGWRSLLIFLLVIATIFVFICGGFGC